MQKLWIVTELFYPDETATAYILTNVANELSQKYDVHVICGPQPQYRPSVTSLEGKVTVHRSNMGNLSKDKLLMRTLRFICIGSVLALKLLWKSRKDDKVLIVTNPAPLVVFASLIKMLKRFELTVLVHDVFPENLIPAGLVADEKNMVYRILKHCFDHSYAKADKIIVLGRDMKEVILRKISKYGSRAEINIIANWADTKNVRPLWTNSQDRIVIQYAGNLGRVQGLMSFVNNFFNAQNEQVLLSFWGKGAIEPQIRALSISIPLITFL